MVVNEAGDATLAPHRDRFLREEEEDYGVTGLERF